MVRNSILRTLRINAPSTVLCLLLFRNVCHPQEMNGDSVRVRLDTMEVAKEIPGKRTATNVFSSHDILTAPGSLDDPLRVLALSGSVVSNSDFQAVPIIGGDQADGILTLLDGFPIAYPYRLLGGFSLLNPLATSGIDLHTGGYPVSFGGFAPTMIRASSKLDYDSHPSIRTDVSLPVTSALVNLPISDSLQWSTKIAVRASHVGLATELLSGSNRQRYESFMPNLKDVQVFLGELPSLHLYTFQEFLMSQEHGSLQSVDRTFDYAWQKGFAGVALITSSDLITTEHRVSWTHDNVSLSTLIPINFLGSERFGIDCKFTTVRLQDQIQSMLLPRLSCTAGTEILYSDADIRFQTFSSWLNNKSPLRSSFVDISSYFQAEWSPVEHASATVGVRGNYFGFVHLAGFEPRGTFIYDFSQRSSVKLSVGQYLQSPTDFQILHGFLMFLAVPNQTPLMMLMSEYRNTLRLQTHSVADLDVTSAVLENRSMAIDVRFDGYYKGTQSLILPARYPSIFTPLDTMSFEPLQAFEALKWGMGVSSRLNLIPLNLSLTASLFSHHSRIVDHRTQKEYYAIGDIPTLAKFLIQYATPSWGLGLLYQYSTGSPTTDQYFLKSTNLVGSTLFLPIWRELNSSRVPDYHRLDLTLTKTWHGINWNVEVVCSVFNLLGNENITSYDYAFSEFNTDFVKKMPVKNTLPFVPNIALRFDYSL